MRSAPVLIALNVALAGGNLFLCVLGVTLGNSLVAAVSGGAAGFCGAIAFFLAARAVLT